MTEASRSGTGLPRDLDKVAQRLLWLCAIAYVAHALYAAWTHRHLYGDAAWFLVRMISEGKATAFYSDFGKEFYYSRFVAYWATQLPTVMVARAGVGDWQILSWVFGATYFSHKLISLIACYLLLPKNEKIAIVFPALGLFAGTINSEIYIVTETHIAVSFLWPLLIAVCQVRDPGKWFFVWCSVATLFAAFSYESMAFFAPVLLLVVLLRRALADPGRRAGWSVLAVAMCVPIIINWMAILLPRDPTNKSAFTGGIMALWNDTLHGVASMHIGPFVSVLVLAVVGLLLLVPLPRSRMLTVVLSCFAALLMVGPALHFVLYAQSQDFTHAITDRGFGGLVIQFALVAMYLVSRITSFGVLRRNASAVVMFVGALAVGQVAWQLLATHSWKHALDRASVSLEQRRGTVACSGEALGTAGESRIVVPAEAIVCHWWAMPLSILLAPDAKVQALLISSESFRPFDPFHAGGLPPMTYAPVDYRTFSAHINDAQLLRPGERVEFAQGRRGIEFLRAGFSHAENWATWTDGESAEVKLCFPGPGSYVATFTMAPFVNPQRPVLQAEVLVNGAPAARWQFDQSAKIVERSVAIGAEGPPRGPGCATVVLRFNDMRPATEIGSAGDPRRLGVAFISLSLQDAGH